MRTVRAPSAGISRLRSSTLGNVVVKVTRVRVCDICESAEGVCRFRITKLEGAFQRTVTTDLCGEHGGTVEAAMSAAPVPRRGRKSGRPVTPVAEINARKTVAKRAAKKAPAKKTGASRSR